MHFLQTLNTYANLLGAFITSLLLLLTAAYVVLTWRNLKAFERTSLHEHRLRHLEDIKRLVARPIREWLENEVLRALEGEIARPIIAVKSVPVRRSHFVFGDPSYDFKLQLDSVLADAQALKGDLIRDAAQNHFPQLVAVQKFSNDLSQFLSEVVVFARESADSIAAKTELPRSRYYMPGTECADSDSLVASCVHDLLSGERPNFGINTRVLGPLIVCDRSSSANVLASGPRDSLLAWVEESATFVIEHWERSGLGEKAKWVRDEAKGVSQSIAGLELTYALPGDCQYVGKSE